MEYPRPLGGSSWVKSIPLGVFEHVPERVLDIRPSNALVNLQAHVAAAVGLSHPPNPGQWR